MVAIYSDFAEMDLSGVRQERSHTSVPCTYRLHTHWPAYILELRALQTEWDQSALSCKACSEHMESVPLGLKHSVQTWINLQKEVNEA